MTFVPAPGVFQVELVYQYDNSKMEQVLHFAGLETNDPAKLTAMANNAFTMWSLTFEHVQQASLHLTSIKVAHLAEQNSPAVEIPFTANNFGSVSYPGMPSNCAICVSMRTQLRGRSYRGRTYIPGITTGAVTGSQINGDIRTQIAGYFDDWEFLDVEGEPYANVVLSRFHNGAPRAQGVATPVVGWTVNPVVASQRRRLPGHGA